MGLTNIRFASDLLRMAGSQRALPAVFPEFNKGVLLNGHFFEQEELDAYAAWLRHPLKDIWLRRDDQATALIPGPADQPIDKPSVVTSSGVQENHTPAYRRSDEPMDTTLKPARAFVLVVRGRSAALCGKVRVLYTLNAAAAAMFEEAVNGYSTVFSAAVLRTDVGRMGEEGGAEFRKVDTVAQLYEAASGEGNGKVIAVLCGGDRFD